MDHVLPIVLLLVGLVVGLVVGVVCAVLIQRGKEQSALDRGKAEAQSQVAMLEERLQARDDSLTELRQRLEVAEKSLGQAQDHEATLQAKLAQYSTALHAERKQASEKLAVINDAQQKLSDAFKALAADALSSNNQSFLELATTSLEKFQELAKGDLAERQKAIDALVKPVSESLKEGLKGSGAYIDESGGVG